MYYEIFVYTLEANNGYFALITVEFYLPSPTLPTHPTISSFFPSQTKEERMCIR